MTRDLRDVRGHATHIVAHRCTVELSGYDDASRCWETYEICNIQKISENMRHSEQRSAPTRFGLTMDRMESDTDRCHR